jgi:hypothetical protein
MGQGESFNVVQSTDLPGAGATVNLFSSLVSTPGCFRAMGCSRVAVVIQNSHTGNLKAYWSDDKGTNWNLYSTEVVAVPAAGASEWDDYEVDTFRDWKLDFVNDGSAQTTWRVNLSVTCGDRSAGV